MGSFISWFERSYKGIIVGLVAIMAVTLVVLAFQHVNGSRPAAGTTAGPIPTFTTAPRYALEKIPDNASVLIIGDSYTQGYGATDEDSNGWAPLVAGKLGWDATIDGIGNTGYTAGGQEDGSGENTFSSRLSVHATLSPDLVILQGSQNDYRATPSDLTKTVKATLALAKKQWPEAVLITLGPSAPQPAGDQYGEISAAIGRGASSAGVPFISPVANHWLTTANSAGYEFEDHQHLNDAGHAYLAERFEKALRQYVRAA